MPTYTTSSQARLLTPQDKSRGGRCDHSIDEPTYSYNPMPLDEMRQPHSLERATQRVYGASTSQSAKTSDSEPTLLPRKMSQPSGSAGRPQNQFNDIGTLFRKDLRLPFHFCDLSLSRLSRDQPDMNTEDAYSTNHTQLRFSAPYTSLLHTHAPPETQGIASHRLADENQVRFSIQGGPHIEGSALLPPMHGGEGATLCPSASHCEGVFPWIERAEILAGQVRGCTTV